MRVEIEGALRKGAALIPVLVQGASMPKLSELPESVRDFAYRNAVQLDAGQDFDVHIARLIRAMDGILEPATVPEPKHSTQPSRMFIGGCIAAGLLCIAAATGWYAGRDRQTISSSTGTNAVPANAVPVPTAASASAPQTPPNTAPAVPSIDAELLFWQSISASNNGADFEEYLHQYPQGRFAGLARNRLAAALTARQPPQPESNVSAASLAPPPSAKCGGNSDEQLFRPIKLLYEAVNTKNINLYAAQWSEDAVYRSASSGTIRTKAEKIANRRRIFALWEKVDLSMDKIAVVERAPDHATVRLTYSMMVKFYDRPARTQTGVGEQYDMVCGSEGHWLIRENIDDG